MILLVAVVLGLIAGLIGAWTRRQPYDLGRFRHLWIVVVAFIPQYLAFYQPTVRSQISQEWAAIALVGSQTLLLAFVWLNRTSMAVLSMGLGLFLNLAVILANGGLMPVSPQTLERLAPELDVTSLPVGARVNNSKDILLPAGSTRLAWLSDRFLLPGWIPYRVAFSVGDVFVAIGVFWLLLQGGISRSSASQDNLQSAMARNT